MDPVSGALIGVLLSELYVVTRNAMAVSIFCKSSCKELRQKLERLQPAIDEICKSDSEFSKHRDQNFREFHDQLLDGVELVKKFERTGSFNLYRKYRYGKKILKLEKSINDFMQTHAVANVMLDVQKIDLGLQDYSHRFLRLEEMGQHIINNVTKMTNDANTNTLMLKQMSTAGMLDRCIGESYDDAMIAEPMEIDSTFSVPDLPNFVVGLNNFVNDVKGLVFQSHAKIIGVRGMGGSGKTTLALALCNDPEVKDFFRNNIVFISVSRFPNPKGLLQSMWDKIVGGQRPDFQNVEDARNQLQKHLRLRSPRPTLVVLDDVWSRSTLENLLFEADGYKTLITTRLDFTIPKERSTRLYNLPLLREADALSLFCFWAFGQTSIPNAENENLVKQNKPLAAKGSILWAWAGLKCFESEGCSAAQGHCLLIVEAFEASLQRSDALGFCIEGDKVLTINLCAALKVIGSSLHGEPWPVWESAKQKLSRAEPISDYHKEGLLNCLETSIDVLDDEAKQCFLDSGAFPEGRKIPVDALLHIWVYVRGMEWQDAFVLLLELASRNLLNLTSDPGSQAISYGCSCELLFSQHDVMRDLALHLANRDNTVHWKRLLMPRREDAIPVKWQTLKDSTAVARIVSIHTGAMDEKQWRQIEFPQAEALFLFFAATEYHLPPFLHTMPKLKVLMIHNYSSKRATLGGLDGFHSLTQIKTVQLERLIIPPLLQHGRSSESLEKLSLSLCEGLGNMARLDRDLSLHFPKLREITVDHCSDLEELPTRMCELTSLQSLSITNCHLLHKLPEDLGRLSLLRVLRLSACPSLATLPRSICKLGRLEFLDISLCRCLEEFPVGIGQLWSLKKLDMRECSGLRQLPKEVDELRSLRHVICDEKVEQQWLSVKASAIPELKVEVVEERFDLDWLDD